MGIQDDLEQTELPLLALAVENGVGTSSQLDYLSTVPFSSRISAHRASQ
jgi:hypothetical protein